MLDSITPTLEWLEDLLWASLGFSGIVLIGLWLTVKTRFAQVRLFPQAVRYALKQSGSSSADGEGVHPLKAFWATLGGAVGIGNIVGICSAVQIGGPGAVFWVWFVAFVGVLLKYTEVYLGMLYRRRRSDGGWDGGPMFYLQKAYGNRLVPAFAACLLCIYGVEVYQFRVIVNAISVNWQLPKTGVMLLLLSLILLALRGGMNRVGKVSARLVPAMIGAYLLMTGYVLLRHLCDLPGVFHSILAGAFQGQAAIGGFAGSSFMQTFAQGIARGCYASDIGIGYTSILHAESSETRPQRQASLTFLGIFADILGMCTLSMLLILVTGVWQQPIDQSLQVQQALALYFPGVEWFMPIMIFFLGYSTVTSFFLFGLRSARFLMPRYGERLYYLYGVLSLAVFTYCSNHQAMLLMSLTGVTLLTINLLAFVLLHRQVIYEVESEE